MNDPTNDAVTAETTVEPPTPSTASVAEPEVGDITAPDPAPIPGVTQAYTAEELAALDAIKTAEGPTTWTGPLPEGIEDNASSPLPPTLSTSDAVEPDPQVEAAEALIDSTEAAQVTTGAPVDGADESHAEADVTHPVEPEVDDEPVVVEQAAVPAPYVARPAPGSSFEVLDITSTGGGRVELALVAPVNVVAVTITDQGRKVGANAMVDLEGRVAIDAPFLDTGTHTLTLSGFAANPDADPAALLVAQSTVDVTVD